MDMKSEEFGNYSLMGYLSRKKKAIKAGSNAPERARKCTLLHISPCM